LRGISTSWSLSPLQYWSQEKHRSKGGKATHARLNTQQTHAHNLRLEHKNTTQDSSTRKVLKSLTQRSKWVAVESRRLRLFRECLVYCSMRLGVPFIAPRQLGAVGDPIGRQSSPFVGWRTGQFSAPPNMNSSCPVPDPLPYRAQSTIEPRVRLAHRTLSGAHRTVWCAQSTVGVGHASPADCTADRWPRAPLAHRTIR
jgi:hypothetical protein